MSDTEAMSFFRSALATDSNVKVVEFLCDLMNEKSCIDWVLKRAFGHIGLTTCN